MTVDEENQGISCLLHRQKYLDEHHKTINPCIFKKPDFCKTLEFVEQSKIKEKTQFILSPHFPTYPYMSLHIPTYPNISQKRKKKNLYKSGNSRIIVYTYTKNQIREFQRAHI